MGKKKYSDKQWTKAFSQGKCVKGCDLAQGACQHVEAMLPTDGPGDSRVTLVPDIGVFSRFATQKVEMGDHTEFEAYLQRFECLSDFDVELLIARFNDNLTLDELASEFRFSSRAVVLRRLHALQDKIKKELLGAKED